MARAVRKKPGCSAAAFRERYGSWALVAGASEGLGATWARALARRGLNLVLVARRRPLLEALSVELREAFGVEVRSCPGDLASPEFVASLTEACSALDLGFVVYNATRAPIGELTSVPAADLERVVDVNIRAPLLLLRALLPGMTGRGRGGVVLMTSLAGDQGAPHLAAYAASKAFTRTLAESLWYELRGAGVDLVACAAGAVRTPRYTAAMGGKDAPGTLDPQEVIETTLRSLHRGPVVIPGAVNKLAHAFMTRVLPRRTAISIMAGSTTDLVPAPDTKGES